jgi:hypothetical protein
MQRCSSLDGPARPGDVGRPGDLLPALAGQRDREDDGRARVPRRGRPAPALARGRGAVLDEVRRYLSPDIQVRCGDVLKEREARAEPLPGVVTIAGGKWTTYRAMVGCLS